MVSLLYNCFWLVSKLNLMHCLCFCVRKSLFDIEGQSIKVSVDYNALKSDCMTTSGRISLSCLVVVVATYRILFVVYYLSVSI